MNKLSCSNQAIITLNYSISTEPGYGEIQSGWNQRNVCGHVCVCVHMHLA